MGFLKTFGKPLDWDESKKYQNVIRKDALEKVIDWINSSKNKKCCPKFGYEVRIFLN
jgi:hypothetical protein